MFGMYDESILQNIAWFDGSNYPKIQLIQWIDWSLGSSQSMDRPIHKFDYVDVIEIHQGVEWEYALIEGTMDQTSPLNWKWSPLPT